MQRQKNGAYVFMNLFIEFDEQNRRALKPVRISCVASSCRRETKNRISMVLITRIARMPPSLSRRWGVMAVFRRQMEWFVRLGR